jgi:hypothetical protein
MLKPFNKTTFIKTKEKMITCVMLNWDMFSNYVVTVFKYQLHATARLLMSACSAAT